MHDRHDEDLFESTKMTFGEHLEELRGALFKSIVALVVGFCVALWPIAPWAYQRIEAPLVEALQEFYQGQSVPRLLELLRERQARGEPLPPAFDGFAEMSSSQLDQAARTFLDGEGMIPEAAYVDAAQVLGELRKHYPEALADPRLGAARKGPAGTTPGMIRVFLWRPLQGDTRTRVKSLNPQEPFLVYIKVAIVCGVVMSSPFIFTFMWGFVAAGLYPHEKRYVHVFMPFSLGLFLAGAGLAFLVVFRLVLKFLFGFNSWLGIDPDPRISEYLSFVLLLPLGFGISFQLPLVMLFLERISVFSVQAYIDKWRIAVLVVAIMSMLLTPADPGSMILMAVPLTVLYFGGIALCKFMPRKKGPFDE